MHNFRATTYHKDQKNNEPRTLLASKGHRYYVSPSHIYGTQISNHQLLYSNKHELFQDVLVRKRLIWKMVNNTLFGNLRSVASYNEGPSYLEEGEQYRHCLAT